MKNSEKLLLSDEEYQKRFEKEWDQQSELRGQSLIIFIAVAAFVVLSVVSVWLLW